MSKVQSMGELVSTGQAKPIAKPRAFWQFWVHREPTAAKCRKIVYHAFARRRRHLFAAIPNIEGLSLDELRATPTTDTILQVGVDSLNARKIPTASNVGAFMDRTGYTQKELHRGICECHGEMVSGETAACMLYRR